MPYPWITGTGLHVPERAYSNDDLAALKHEEGPLKGQPLMETSDQWIRERTGIVKRHLIIEPKPGQFDSVGVGTSDLALPACRQALEAAGRSPEEVDLIAMGTMTPDLLLPGSACLLQAKLGCPNAAAFDLNAACTGFLYTLAVVEKFQKTGASKVALCIGADIMSNRLDWTDRDSAVLFGDGAAACVVEAGDDPGGVISTHLHADGSRYKVLYATGGGSFAPATHAQLDTKDMFVKLSGREVFTIGVRRFGEAIQECLDANGLTEKDIDVLVPHQANARIIEAVARRFGVSMEKVIVTIDRFGNTVAASIPMALHTALAEGRIEKGMNVVLVAFGGGLTWGSALIKW